MLQKQNIGPGGKQFSVRAPQTLVTALETFAFDRRMTQSNAVTRLLTKALKAESGEKYLPEICKEATS